MKFFSKAATKTTVASTALVSGALPTAALIVTGGEGDEGKSLDLDHLKKRHENFHYTKNVVKIGGGTGIYIGAKGEVGYLLTAGHLEGKTNSVVVDGVIYATHGAELVGNGDLRLLTIGGQVGDPTLPDLPTVPLATQGVSEDDEIIMLGRGTRMKILDGSSKGATHSTVDGQGVYHWGEIDEINWAENRVEEAPEWLGGGVTATWSADDRYKGQNVFFSRFDEPSSDQAKKYEGQAAPGDSGGPAFIRDEETGEYLLAGITHGVQKNYGQPDKTAAFSNRTAYVNLADYIDQIEQIFDSTSLPESTANLVGLSGSIKLIVHERSTDLDSDEAESEE